MTGFARRRRLLLGWSILLLALGGCDWLGLGSDPGSAAAGNCAWMSSTEPPPGAAATVILADISASVRDGDNSGPTPDYRDQIEIAVRAAVARRDAVSIATFGGTSTDVTWAVRNRSTDWTRDNDNPQNQDSRKQQAVDCLNKLVAAALSARPPTGGSDVLWAVGKGAAAFDRDPASKRLLVFTDGLATTGCADLTHAALRSDDELKAVVAQCAAEPLLKNNELSGVHVEFYGLGQHASGLPLADPPQLDWLNRMWEKICDAATGGRPNCAVSAASVSGAKAASRHPEGPLLDDPVIPFSNGTIVVYPLPGAASFDGDSAVLRDDVRKSLIAIAVKARASSVTSVQVNGYTNPSGAARVKFNQGLSERRASAVLAVLQQNGVTKATARGFGDTTYCPDIPALRSLQRAECYRRVDIVINGR